MTKHQGPPYWGKYRGFCRDHHDPFMVGRIRAEVPFPLGKGPDNWSVWASPCLPPGHFDVPEEGDGVWIEFQNGDPNSPVWVGVWYLGAGATTSAPLQGLHGPMLDMDGNDVETDRDHAADQVDHAEHTELPGHDHAAAFYTPHRRSWSSGSGHLLEWNDHPGLSGLMRLKDRMDRGLRATMRGITQLVSTTINEVTALWEDLDGAPVTARHELTFADYYSADPAEGAGQFVRLRDMAGGTLLMRATPGVEQLSLFDFWNQHVTIRSVKDAEYIEIMDKGGQSMKWDPIGETVRVSDANGNYILMADGKITLFVPPGQRVHIGGEAGQALATKDFVETYYNAHTHVSGAPGSPTSRPIIQSPLTPGSDITNKQRSE